MRLAILIFMLLALCGCSQLPLCEIAQAHLIQTPQGSYAAFDARNLDIFRKSHVAHATGKCKFADE